MIKKSWFIDFFKLKHLSRITNRAFEGGMKNKKVQFVSRMEKVRAEAGVMRLRG